MSENQNSQYKNRNQSSPIYYRPPTPWSASPPLLGHNPYRYDSELIKLKYV